MHTTRASLLHRIRDRQDTTAWGEFDAIYRPLLGRFARARGLNDDQVEDVIQHCMTAVSQHIDRFDYDPRKGRFAGWLRTLVNNRVRNLLRNRREQQAQTQDFHRQEQSEQTPDELFDKLWMQEHLRHCLRLVRKEVDEADYTAFRQYVIEEQPVEVVCGALNITAARLYKIKWRLTRKVGEKMKELLQGQGQGCA